MLTPKTPEMHQNEAQTHKPKPSHSITTHHEAPWHSQPCARQPRNEPLPSMNGGRDGPDGILFVTYSI